MCTLISARRLIMTQLSEAKYYDLHRRNSDRMVSVDITALDMVMEDYAGLQAKTECAMGVGDGSGKRFVFGDYASIKAAQGMVLSLDQCQAAMQEFCTRVEIGEIRSVKTYAKFKELLK